MQQCSKENNDGNKKDNYDNINDNSRKTPDQQEWHQTNNSNKNKTKQCTNKVAKSTIREADVRCLMAEEKKKRKG